MNNDRRKRLQEAKDSLEDIITQIEEVKDDEQEALDNLPDSFQQTERGEKMQNAIESMDEAISTIGEVQDWIDEATQ